jgi:Tol biopolymer transport system component
MIVKPVDSFCVWPPTQIADVEVRNFIWSDDNLNLIYKEKGGEWYIYTISSGETREYILDSEITEPPEAFGIQSYYHFFISPDGKSVVYTIVNQDGFSIYLKNLDEEAPVFLGDIKGWIEKYEWLNDGTRLILSINWLMKLGAPEAYVYMVDIIEKKVNVIIPSSSEYRDISYFGITPDDSKLLFVTYSGPDRSLRLWDMTDDSVIVTKIHQTLTFKWLPNSQEFVAAGYQNESLKVRIFIYNIETGIVRYMSPFQIDDLANYLDAIQISPNLKNIAFIDGEHLHLFLIDCSQIVP